MASMTRSEAADCIVFHDEGVMNAFLDGVKLGCMNQCSIVIDEVGENCWNVSITFWEGK